MSLPELEWQFVYARLAWAAVLAGLIVALLPAALRRSGRVAAALFVAAAVWAALPGDLSVAYWLVLAFQWPSALLAGLCVLRLCSPARGTATLPVTLAAPLAIAGTVLYLDTIGWLSLGLYYAGFGPVGAPATAVLGAVACAVCIVRGVQRPFALVLLVSLVLFALFRLPTGNLWDVLLDPLLWAWAVVSLGISAWRGLALRLRRARPAAPVTAPAHASGIEHS